ncbi:MAG: nucleotidyltransferase family protein [Clostridia bacterium]|nr:nucleotidyltransferase family protein [Clostridia bacterium]
MDEAQLKRALLSVVNRYLHGTPLCDCSDWARVYALAKAHSLVGVFYFATQGSDLPEEVLQRAKADFEVDVMQQTLQDYYAEELFRRFQEKKLPFLPMKGYHTRRLYAQPEARSSCDLDVFYDQKDKDEIEKIMTEVGFSFVIEAQNHQEWAKDSVAVEMHYALLSQVPLFDEYYQNVWDRLTVVEGSEYAFCKEDEYIYHLVHAAKHMAHSGFGVRTVLDTYLYVKKIKFDKVYLDGELKKLGLYQFTVQLERLANVWFGGVDEDDEMRFLGGFVLSCGAYGNRRNLALRGDGTSVGRAKRKHLWKAIFPAYRDMRAWYPIVKKAPITLPFVWVYRWFEVLFTRRQSISNITGDLKKVDKKGIQGMKKVKEIMGVTQLGNV